MAAERVFKICKCFGHLLALKLPWEETTFKDVQRISKYAGKNLCERVLCDVIVKANSSWSNLVEDVIKTAGKAALLSGERQEMEKFLSLEIPLQAMDLEIGINLYKKILGSMRKVELQKCSEELKDKLQKQAQHILAQGPTGINSMDVDQLLRWYKHLVRHDPQNDAKHIFDKTSPKTFVQLYPSTDLIIPSGPKLFLIFFPRMF